MVKNNNIDLSYEKLKLTSTEENRGLSVVNLAFDQLRVDLDEIYSEIGETTFTFFEKEPDLSHGVNSQGCPYVTPIEIFVAVPYSSENDDVLSGSILGLYKLKRGCSSTSKGRFVGLFAYIDGNGSSEASITRNHLTIQTLPAEELLRIVLRKSASISA